MKQHHSPSVVAYLKKYMNKVVTISVLLTLSFLILGNTIKISTLNATDYEKNLNTASELYLNKIKIPESILVKLVPKNHVEFGIYYGTTGPDHKLGKTDFFYETSRLIFKEVIFENNSKFYSPSLNLISFADGEFAKEYTDNLELIIRADKERFCDSIKGKEYAKRNPIKYYSALNKCK